MEQCFTNVYENNSWGNNNNAEYNGSGEGSAINYNENTYIPFLKKFITNNINIVDLGCGDFRQLSCEYFPLKKYNPVKLYNYYSKEVSVIVC